MSTKDLVVKILIVKIVVKMLNYNYNNALSARIAFSVELLFPYIKLLAIH